MPKRNRNQKRRVKKRQNPSSTRTKPSALQASRAPYAPGVTMSRTITSDRNRIPKLAKSVHEQVCAITDPFCYKARCAKWPDGQGSGTIAFQVRGRQTLATGAPGTGLVQIMGDLPYNTLAVGAYAAGPPPTWTYANVYSLGNGTTNFASFTNAWRIVTWGIIVRNVQPANTAQGTVIIRKLSKPYVKLDTQEAVLMYGSEVAEYSLYPGMEISVISKPLGTQARTFAQQNSSSGLSTTVASWETLQVEIVNGPASATSVVDIEYVYNVECTLVATQIGLHEFIPPAAPNVPKLAEASASVVNKATTIVEGGVKAVGEHVLGKVEDFFSQAGSDLLGLLF